MVYLIMFSLGDRQFNIRILSGFRYFTPKSYYMINFIIFFSWIYIYIYVISGKFKQDLVHDPSLEF